MNVLLWHVHGSWTTAFVHGRHRYLVPTTPDRGPYGLGRARTYPWPDTTIEIHPDDLPTTDVDLVILQRPEEIDLTEQWLHRRPGRDVPAIYVEHNTPKDGDVPHSRHPLADRDDLLIAHVTHFNDLFWDCGGTRTTVVEHGIVPPAVEYTGDLERLAVVTNEPVRRWRVTGTDLIPRFTPVAPLDVFGMGVAGLADALAARGPLRGPTAAGGARVGGTRADGTRGDVDADLLPLTAHEDLPQATMHAELARRRAYLHLCRWTSLGLSLIEAMAIGMPVVALATTEAVDAVPPDAGVLSTRVDTLVEAARWLVEDRDAAYRLGARAREVAKERFGLDRFLADWDRLMEEETCA